MKVLIGFCLLFTVSAFRQKRQVQPCVDTWSLNAANNPCKQVGGLVYYPHPQDSRKFIQCGVFRRMYIVQCPSGMTYSQATTSCQNVTSTPGTNVPGNLCTQAHINSGQVYWSFPGDNTKFVECNANGVANVLHCPTGLLWDQTKVSCVYPAVTSGGTIVSTIHPPHTGMNYCTQANINAGKMYFPHPDKHKFIQCDIAGNAYVNSCPSGLYWNVGLETCYKPFNVISSIG